MVVRALTLGCFLLLSFATVSAQQIDTKNDRDLGPFECVYLGIANSERRFTQELVNGSIAADREYLCLNGGGRTRGKQKRVLDLKYSRLMRIRFDYLRKIDLLELPDSQLGAIWTDEQSWKQRPLNELPVAELAAPAGRGRFRLIGPTASGRVLYHYETFSRTNKTEPLQGLYQMVRGTPSLLVATAPEFNWFQHFRVIGSDQEWVYICGLGDHQSGYQIFKINLDSGLRVNLCELPTGRSYAIGRWRFDSIGKLVKIRFFSFNNQARPSQKLFLANLKTTQHEIIEDAEFSKERPSGEPEEIRSHDPHFEYVGHELLSCRVSPAFQSKNELDLKAPNFIEKISLQTGETVAKISPPAGYLFTDTVYVTPLGRLVAQGIKIPDPESTGERNQLDVPINQFRWVLLSADASSDSAEVVAEFPAYMQDGGVSPPINLSRNITVHENMAYFVAHLPASLRVYNRQREGTSGIFRIELGSPIAD